MKRDDESEGVHCNLSQDTQGRIAASAADKNRVVAG
jgi:hypothetical protein